MILAGEGAWPASPASGRLDKLSKLLEQEAMPGTEVGSGWTIKAIRVLIEERFSLRYSQRGARKLMRTLNWSYQRGRKLYIKRSQAEQRRFEFETAEVLAELAASGEKSRPWPAIRVKFISREQSRSAGIRSASSLSSRMAREAKPPKTFMALSIWEPERKSFRL